MRMRKLRLGLERLRRGDVDYLSHYITIHLVTLHLPSAPSATYPILRNHFILTNRKWENMDIDIYFSIAHPCMIASPQRNGGSCGGVSEEWQWFEDRKI